MANHLNALLSLGKYVYRHFPPMAKPIRIIQRVLYNCDIPFQANIDKTVHFDHMGFGCVINPRVTIGGGSEIQHGVTLEELEAGGPTPTIGKDVYIGAHAVVLGGVTVGDGAKIGACALVLNDVPAGCTAVGVPAKIVC